MKKIYLALGIAVGMMFSSCSDFLDQEPSIELPTESAITTTSDLRNAVNGIAYVLTESRMTYASEFALFADTRCNDFKVTADNNQLGELRFYMYNSKGSFNDYAYFAFYQALGNVNSALKSIENGQVEGDAAEINNYKGQLLAWRGMLHFDLARMFCHIPTTVENPASELGLVLSDQVFDKDYKGTRTDLASTYTFIIKQFTDALPLLEKMDENPTELIPEELRNPGEGTKGIEIDLDKGIDAVRAELSKYPVSTRVNLKGTIIVARDIAHAKLKARLDAGEEMPEYFKNHPILYAGPAKTPEGYPCGSMGPTTANRMDPYVDEFQDHGASLVMIAKGNRGDVVTEACKKHGGFYLGTIGGVAAVLSKSSIKSIDNLFDLGNVMIDRFLTENMLASLDSLYRNRRMSICRRTDQNCGNLRIIDDLLIILSRVLNTHTLSPCSSLII